MKTFIVSSLNRESGYRQWSGVSSTYDGAFSRVEKDIYRANRQVETSHEDENGVTELVCEDGSRYWISEKPLCLC